MEEEQFLGNGAEIFIFVMVLFVILYSFSACILLIYSMHKNDQITLNHIPTILSSIFYFISSVIFLFVLSYFNENDNDNFDNDKNFTICVVLFVLFLILAKISVYTQCLIRLYATFKNSTLELRNSTIIIAIFLLCLLFLTVVWWMTLIIVRYLTLDKKFDSYDPQFFPISIFLFIFDVSLSWLVVGLFTNKLLKSIMFKSRSDFFAKTGRYLNGSNSKRPPNKTEIPTSSASFNNPSFNNPSNGHASSGPTDQTKPISINCTSVDLNEDDENENENENKEEEEVENGDNYDPVQRQKSRTRSHVRRISQRRSSFEIDIAFASIDESDKQRLAVITKYFMLSSLSIITTQIIYVSVIIGLIIVSVSDIELNQNAAMAVFGGVFYPLEVVLNCMALYLTFQYASDHYDKICKPCHERCSLCVFRRAAGDILRRHSAEITTIDLDKFLEFVCRYDNKM